MSEDRDRFSSRGRTPAEKPVFGSIRHGFRDLTTLETVGGR